MKQKRFCDVGDNTMRKAYTENELKNIINPIAESYGVERVFMFGSCARGNQNENSDLDLRIDKGDISDYFVLSAFNLDIEDALNETVDIITTGSLDSYFLDKIKNEEVLIYERA